MVTNTLSLEQQQVLAVLLPEMRTEIAHMSAEDVCRRLRDLSNSRLVALTDGSNGSVFASADTSVVVPIVKRVKVVDATGAGDAFLGGLVAGMYHEGVPSTADELMRMGQLANATGAACVQVLGGLPTETTAATLTSLLEVQSPIYGWVISAA